MGSIGVHEADSIDGYANRFFDGGADEEGFTSFQINDVADDQETIPNVLRVETVLLSWFLTLLRTRDNANLCFDWVHHGPSTKYLQGQRTECFSIGDLMTNVKERVGLIANTLSSRLKIHENKAQTGKSAQHSLILSTSSKSADQVDEQVSHPLESLPQGWQITDHV